MNHKRIGLLLIAIAGLMGVSASSYAGMPVPSALSIQASACEPYRSQDYEKIELASGYWRFKSGKKGPVTLECPFPGGAIATHMYGPGGFADARLMLRDGDGAGTAARVRVRYITRSNEATSLSDYFDSNIDGNTATTIFRTDSMGIGPQMMAPDTLGYFHLEMFRSDTTTRVYFGGILLDDLISFY